MHGWRVALPALLVALLATPRPAGADVQLTIQDGRVTLTARSATVREILAEWARVGHTRVLNGERVAGAPVTLQLLDVPEAQALEVVLRSVSGYLAAPRRTAGGPSRFERILVLPTSVPPRVTAPSPPPFQAPQALPAPFNPQFNPQLPQPGDVPAADDDQGGQRPASNARTPVFNTFPQPPQGTVPSPAINQPAPGRIPSGTQPIGVAVPGMPVPAPSTPGQVPGGQQPAGPGAIPLPPGATPNEPQ
jgi:hypothetical protein